MRVLREEENKFLKTSTALTDVRNPAILTREEYETNTSTRHH